MPLTFHNLPLAAHDHAGLSCVKIQGSAVSDSFGNTTAVVEIGAPAAGASEKNLGAAELKAPGLSRIVEPKLAKKKIKVKVEVGSFLCFLKKHSNMITV